MILFLKLGSQEVLFLLISIIGVKKYSKKHLLQLFGLFWLLRNFSGSKALEIFNEQITIDWPIIDLFSEYIAIPLVFHTPQVTHKRVLLVGQMLLEKSQVCLLCPCLHLGQQLAFSKIGEKVLLEVILRL